MTLNVAPIMPPLQQILWDKTLNVPLAGGFVHFFEDSARTTPKVVYQLEGTGPGSYTYVSLGSVLTLSGIGTFVDNSGENIPIYLWPFLGTPNDQPPSEEIQNYYIEVYSSTGVFQFDIPNWPGIQPGEGGPTNTFDITENIISNGQFVDVVFSKAATAGNPVIFNTTLSNQETVIAPDWSVVTTGTGSFSVWQVPIADSTAPGNPAYALGITSASYLTPIMLRQRILSPRILAGSNVSGTFIAESSNGIFNLTMNYTPSITGNIQEICTGPTSNSGFVIIASTASVLIANPGSGTGYVDITIVIPVGATVQISCVQLCGVPDGVETVAYLQESPEREIDHLFHYFQPQINFKPVSSLLTGWDFPLNPGQFFNPATPITTTPAYILDQTICASAVNSMTVAISPNTGAFNIQPSVANDAFYLLQYLQGGQALETTLSNLSVNISAYSLTNPGVTVRVYLYYSSGGGTIPLLSSGLTIGTIASSGVFTLTAGNWSAIPNIYGPSQSATLPYSASASTASPDTGFNGWTGRSFFNATSTANFAIVTTFAFTTAIPSIFIDSISLTPGDIPTRPATQTEDEVLRECQYYYESSKQTSTAEYYSTNCQAVPGTGTFAYAEPFTVEFRVPKRIEPQTVSSSIPLAIYPLIAPFTLGTFTVELYYATTGGSFGATALANQTFISYYEVGSNSAGRVAYFPVTPSVIQQQTSGTSASLYYSAGYIGFTYIADSRLGVV